MRQDWLQVRGDDTLALDWPLTAESHVWEIGGFEGRWAGQMAEKFDCHIDIFEPQIWAVERLHEKFKGNPKVITRPYGLWVDDGYFPLSKYFTDGASLMETKDPNETRLETRLEHFKYYGKVIDAFVPPIDVGLMNIEGAEYYLIPAMVANGKMERFEHFWCQFHTAFEMYAGQTDKIYENMSHTHDLLWDCFPTAVAWKKRK